MSALVKATTALLCISVNLVAGATGGGSALRLQRSIKLQKVAISPLEKDNDVFDVLEHGSVLGLQRSKKLVKSKKKDMDALEHASVLGLQRGVNIERNQKMTACHDVDCNVLKHVSNLGFQRGVKLVKGKQSAVPAKAMENDSSLRMQHDASLKHVSTLGLQSGKRLIKTPQVFHEEMEDSTSSALEIERSGNEAIGGHVRMLAISAAVVSIAFGLVHSVYTDIRAAKKQAV